MSNWWARLARMIFGRAKWDAVSLLAFSLMPSDTEGRALAEYLICNPDLAAKLRMHTYLLEQTDEEFKRWCLAGLFVNYATVLAEQGGLQGYNGATGAACYALLFFEDYPLAWACYALIQVECQNSIAARWAKKLLYFRPTKTRLDFYDKVMPDGQYKILMTGLRSRMKEVVAVCNLHPEWSDSYQFLAGIENYQRMLGKFN